MVPISKDLKIVDSPTLVVYSPEGQYADTDLILCADETSADVPVAMFQAQFVKYGPVVYQFNTPEETGKAVYALDPDSTLDAVVLYKEQLARDAARLAGTLQPSDPVPAPDSNAEEIPETPTDPLPEEVAPAETAGAPQDAADTSSVLEPVSSLPSDESASTTSDLSTTTLAVPDADTASSTATSTP